MMRSAPLPENENERLAALRRYKVLDSEKEKSYDDLVYLASHICQTPISLVSLVDENRQWFKARVGLAQQETSRDVAFCAHAILTPGVLVVPDALRDKRFADNPLVIGDPKIRFYAGAPLITSDGYSLGTLCVIDRTPRTLNEEQTRALQALSRQTTVLLELRKNLDELAEALGTLKLISGLLPICAWCHKIRDDEGDWTILESYLSHHTEANFTHGICPDCAERVKDDARKKRELSLAERRS